MTADKNLFRVDFNNIFWRKYQSQIMNAPIFAGLSESEVANALEKLKANRKSYQKDSLIIKAGDKISRMGLLLNGEIAISHQDIKGNQFIITHFKAPSLFAEVLACAALDTSPVTIKALTGSEVLMLDFNSILDPGLRCSCKEKLIGNVLRLLARKNLVLNDKLDIMSRRTLKSRIAAMLLAAAGSSGSEKFILPYNRQAMADYLAVDRSSLSRELGKMKNEGLIRFNRQTFEILDFTALSDNS